MGYIGLVDVFFKSSSLIFGPNEILLIFQQGRQFLDLQMKFMYGNTQLKSINVMSKFVGYGVRSI